ncbi:MAG: GTPase, partial [Pseudomonadota bacterium]
MGKSRMFNRLSSADTQAIVHDFEGVTRDRQYGEGLWYSKRFTLIDTGGFVPASDEPMLTLMRMQAQLAIEEADAIIFMMDGRQGVTSSDMEIATMLRETQKPVFHVVNKIDSAQRAHEFLTDFYRLGVDLYATSAEHGPGVEELMDDVCALIPAAPEEEPAPPPYARVAVVGKPNAGKSSIINRLLGEERLLTSDVAGTTRDSVDTMLRRNGREYMLIDTAGLRVAGMGAFGGSSFWMRAPQGVDMAERAKALEARSVLIEPGHA